MTLLFMVIATRSADYFNQTLHDTFRLEHEKDELLPTWRRRIVRRNGRRG